MEFTLLLTIVALVVGFYMAWNIGANDVANAISTSVGSKALTLKHAVIIAAILEFVGAFFIGGHVSKTIQSDVLNTSMFTMDPSIYVHGMVAVLLAAGCWLQIASFYGLPVSTTHALIGAILGFGLIQYGIKGINWPTVGSIFSSWIISPLLGGTIAFFVFSVMRKKIFYSFSPIKEAKKLVPTIIFLLFSIISMSILYKGPKRLHLNFPFLEALGISIIIGLLFACILYFILKRAFASFEDKEASIEDRKKIKQKYKHEQMLAELTKTSRHLFYAKKMADNEEKEHISKLQKELKSIKKSFKVINNNSLEMQYLSVEKIFSYLQVISVAFIALAHGSNDVANAIGPLAGIIFTIKHNAIAVQSQIPLWILALGGAGIMIGLATWGWRVVETIGKKITSITPSRGFAAEFSAATTIVIASKLAMPISTTHTLVGAVLGVGLARGIGALNLSVIRDIILSWLLTIPAGAFLSILFFYIIRVIIL